MTKKITLLLILLQITFHLFSQFQIEMYGIDFNKTSKFAVEESDLIQSNNKMAIRIKGYNGVCQEVKCIFLPCKMFSRK